jgi:hypothetical protein
MKIKSGLKKLDNKAADFLPIRLIVSLVVIVAITGLMGFGLYNLSITQSENQVDQECKELISSLNSMVAKGEPRDVYDVSGTRGSTRVVELDLPDNLLYLSFGMDPDPLNNGKLRSGLDGEGNVIFYKLEGGSKKSIWLDEDFKFREGLLYSKNPDKWIIIPSSLCDPEGYVISDGGETTITFELVKDGQENLILIHARDEFFGGLNNNIIQIINKYLNLLRSYVF